MGFYFISEIQDIVFYGVNEYSLRMKEAALSAGKNIIAFIDRRAKKIGEIDGIPVYDEFVYADVETCLIIALQNALQHDEIAKSANKHGFERILYVPMDVGIESQKAQTIRSAYNSMLLNDWNAEKRPIADYQELYRNNNLCILLGEGEHDNEIANKKYSIVRVSADLVYTSTEDDGYADIPLAAFKPYESLFNYYGKQGEEEPDIPNNYLERNAQKNIIGDNDFDKTIALRGKCIEKYTEFFQDGLDFAISCAPLAKRNNRGCFNLCEGHHRSMWLLRSGIYYLPLRISIDDYTRFANDEQVAILSKDVLFHVIKQQTIISSLRFNRISFYNKFSLMKLMVDIQRDCFNIVQGRQICVYDSFWGYFAFNIYRMKASKVMYYLHDKLNFSVFGKLEALYGIKLSYNCESYGGEGDVLVFLGEISGVNKLEIIAKAQRNRRIVISNLTNEETCYLNKDYNKSYIGKLFFDNKIESVYVLRPG